MRKKTKKMMVVVMRKKKADDGGGKEDELMCVGRCWLVYYCAYVCTGYVCVCVYVYKYPTVGLVLHDDSHCLF